MPARQNGMASQPAEHPYAIVESHAGCSGYMATTVPSSRSLAIVILSDRANPTTW